MKIGNFEMEFDNFVCALAIIIGGLYAIVNPCDVGTAFSKTIGAVVLAKFFL